MQAKQVLHKLLQKTCPEMHKMRRTALSVNVMAALHGEVLTVTHLGRAIRSEAKEKHCIKRADHLLSNRRLQGDRVDTVRDRVVLSTIFLGLKVVDNHPRVELRLADVLAAINSLHAILQRHCQEATN